MPGRGAAYAAAAPAPRARRPKLPLPPPAPPLPAELVSRATLLADRNAILPLLPRGGIVVEVGVAMGDFSRMILDVCRPTCFVAIDYFCLHELPVFWGKPPRAYFGDATHAEWYRARFADELAAGRMSMLQGESAEQIATLPDAGVDVFYVDGDHRYPGIRRDLDALARKIRPDGWLVLNDYIMVEELGAAEPCGVIYAAHEFMLQHGWAMQYLALQTSMFCDVVLRRADLVRRPDEAQVAALSAENARLRDEVAALRASTSWRATAPLRALGRLRRRDRASA